jgi:hypothetical protein
MTSPTITDADRKEASLFLWCMDLGTNEELAQAFAAHRIAALEQAVRVADEFDAPHVVGVAQRIAAAIRALV